MHHPYMYTQGTVLPCMPYIESTLRTLATCLTSSQVYICILITGPLWSLHFSSCVRHVLSTLLTNLHDQSIHVTGPIYKQFSDTQCIHVHVLRTNIVVCISCMWCLHKFTAYILSVAHQKESGILTGGSQL